MNSLVFSLNSDSFKDFVDINKKISYIIISFIAGNRKGFTSTDEKYLLFKNKFYAFRIFLTNRVCGRICEVNYHLKKYICCFNHRFGKAS